MLTANQRCYSKQPLHSRDVTDSEFVFQTRRYWDTGNEVTQLGYMYNTYNSCAFSALTPLVGHPACKKNWVVGCWHGNLSGAKCRLHMVQLIPLCVCYNSSLLHHTDSNVFVGTAQRQRRCHAARTMTSLSARRDDDDDVATTWGDVVSSCRVYCNQTNWKQRRHSQYAHMASWLCMCTVNGVVAFNELDYSGQANLQCT